MVYELRKYSAYDQFTEKTEGKNISSILTRVLQEAAKLTRSYTSDILYMPSLIEAVEKNQNYDQLLIFRSSGIDTKPVVDDRIDVEWYGTSEHLEYWRLKSTVNPDNLNSPVTIFERVSLREEKQPASQGITYTSIGAYLDDTETMMSDRTNGAIKVIQRLCLDYKCSSRYVAPIVDKLLDADQRVLYIAFCKEGQGSRIFERLNNDSGISVPESLLDGSYDVFLVESWEDVNSCLIGKAAWTR